MSVEFTPSAPSKSMAEILNRGGRGEAEAGISGAANAVKGFLEDAPVFGEKDSVIIRGKDQKLELVDDNKTIMGRLTTSLLKWLGRGTSPYGSHSNSGQAIPAGDGK